jgi:hypothetical protein
MDIRSCVLGLAGRARVGDRIAFGDERALPHAKRAEMDQ